MIFNVFDESSDVRNKKSLVISQVISPDVFSPAGIIISAEESTLQLQAEGTIKKEAVKKSTVKESTVEENTVKNECFIKLKAALTPTV